MDENLLHETSQRPNVNNGRSDESDGLYRQFVEHGGQEQAMQNQHVQANHFSLSNPNEQVTSATNAMTPTIDEQLQPYSVANSFVAGKRNDHLYQSPETGSTSTVQMSLQHRNRNM